MTSSWIGLDTAEWAIVAAGAAAIIGFLALVTSWVLGLNANAASARANEIAESALAIEERRLHQEDRAVVLPERYDKNGSAAIFRVVSTNPLQQVEFEFRNYAGVGGLWRKDHVAAGEHRGWRGQGIVGTVTEDKYD